MVNQYGVFLNENYVLPKFYNNNFPDLGKASAAKFSFIYKTEVYSSIFTDNCSCLIVSKKLSLSFNVAIGTEHRTVINPMTSHRKLY